MEVKKRDSSTERKVLIGMIVSKPVLSRISARWDREMFRSKWCDLVGGWCVKHFRRYGRAPGRDIEGLFETWSEESDDKETIALVDKFLSSLSDEYKQAKKINAEYLIDLAGGHFNKVRGERFVRTYGAHLENGDLDKAEAARQKFHKIELGAGAGIDVLRDMSAITEAFHSTRDPLIKYPGALGDFWQDALERDALIGLMGPEKRGKTWWLIDLAWRGMLQGRKVAFFEVGDMSQNQIMRRFMVRASRTPMKPGEIKYPKFINHPDPETMFTEVDFETYTFKKSLNEKTASRACRKIIEKSGTDECLLKLACYPNTSISINGVQAAINGWELEGWVPDVVVIDYADILQPITGVTDSRDQIDMTWRGMRSLSQSSHCLVVTATQADAASYSVETMSMSNFSNDKRKFSHVNGMVGLNQTPPEKKNATMRLQWIVLRENEFSIDRCVYVAQCLGLANPAVKSTF